MIYDDGILFLNKEQDNQQEYTAGLFLSASTRGKRCLTKPRPDLLSIKLYCEYVNKVIEPDIS